MKFALVRKCRNAKFLLVNRALTRADLWSGPIFCAGRSRDFGPMASAAPHTPPATPATSRSPFVRLTDLIADIKPGKPPINLSVGEPQHPIPKFVGGILNEHLADFGRYPANKGTERYRRAVAAWLNKRYALKRHIDPDTEVLVLSGTREGLFLSAIAAMRWVSPRKGKPGSLPAMLIPNPFYAVYAAAAVAANCEPVFLPATKASGFLPDLDALTDDLLARTAAMYLASPANPQGAVADIHYITRLVALARKHGFLIFSDECYS